MLLIVFLSLDVNSSNAQWTQEKFIIGTFADPRISINNDLEKDSISFKRASDAGFNLLSGPQFYMGGRDFKMMDRTLDLAGKFGMKLLAIDFRMRVAYDDFTKNAADTILSHFRSVNRKRRSALYGYYFGGEFSLENSDKIKFWTEYFQKKDPNRLAYSYLLPRIAFKSNDAYVEYLDAFLMSKNGKQRPAVVAYDYYPFLKNDIISNYYFYNLNIIRKKAEKRPFWCYVLTTKHGNYSNPNQYQLAFMAFSPLAYGAKGLLYFSYETIPKNYGGDYDDAIIGANDKPTFKYDIVKHINNYINNIVGPVIMSSRYIGTYHVSNQPSGEVILMEQLINSNTPLIASIDSESIMVGIFKATIKNRKYYLFLVNKSSRILDHVKVTLKGDFQGRIYTSPGYIYGKNNIIKVSTNFNIKSKTTDFIAALQPGEGRLIEIE